MMNGCFLFKIHPMVLNQIIDERIFVEKKNLTVKKASLSIKPEIALIRLLRTNFRFWYDFYELKILSQIVQYSK